jgi:hypothetical protein
MMYSEAGNRTWLLTGKMGEDVVVCLEDRWMGVQYRRLAEH